MTGWSYTLPAGSWAGHFTKYGTRMPPSSVVRFEPRSGVLIDALPEVPGIVGPPLSLMKNTSVFSSSCASRSLSSTAPIASSIADIIAAYVRRRSSPIYLNFSSRSSVGVHRRVHRVEGQIKKERFARDASR